MNNVDFLTFHCDIDPSVLTESDAGVNPSIVPCEQRCKLAVAELDWLPVFRLKAAVQTLRLRIQTVEANGGAGFWGLNLVPQAKNSGSGSLPVGYDGRADSGRRD